MAKQSNKSQWVLGYHAVSAVLAINPERAIAVSVASAPNNTQQASIIATAKEIGLPVHQIDKRELSRRCGSEQHQGVALEAKPKQDGGDQELSQFINKRLSSDAAQAPLLLILDQVQDPHNFGACLRTADAAGADAVIVAKDNASPMTPVVLKVASGAAETMPIFRVTNLARTMDALSSNRAFG